MHMYSRLLVLKICYCH